MKRRLICGILTIFILVFAGCDTYAMVSKYPFDRADKWVCEETDFTIEFTNDEDNLTSGQKSVLRWNNEEFNVLALFHVGYFRVDIDENLIPSQFPDRKMLTGTWEYINGNMVLFITEDYLYNGEFRTLAFVPQ